MSLGVGLSFMMQHQPLNMKLINSKPFMGVGMSKRHHDLACRTLTFVGACAHMVIHVPTGHFLCAGFLFAQDQVGTSR